MSMYVSDEACVSCYKWSGYNIAWAQDIIKLPPLFTVCKWDHSNLAE